MAYKKYLAIPRDFLIIQYQNVVFHWYYVILTDYIINLLFFIFGHDMFWGTCSPHTF